MARSILAWMLERVYNSPGLSWLGVILGGLLSWGIILPIVLLLSSCATEPGANANLDSRYFYTGDMSNSFIAWASKTMTVHKLPWKEFNEEAWKRKFQKPICFIDGFEIYAKVELSEEQYNDCLFHELGHAYEWYSGEIPARSHGGHNWRSYQPGEYYKKAQETVLLFDRLRSS